MEEVKVSELPEASSVNNEDSIMIVQNGVNKKAQKDKVRNIVVSSTEPTTGEKVWFKTGENLLNKDAGFINKYITATGEIKTGNNNALFNQKIRILPSTDYTISCGSTVQNFAFAFYDEDYQFISRESLTSTNKMTKTSPTNAKYLKVQFNYDNVTTVTQSMIDSLNIMLNQGSSELQYEAYINKGIYTKNENGTFNIFYNEGRELEDVVLMTGSYSTTNAIQSKTPTSISITLPIDLELSNDDYIILATADGDGNYGNWISVTRTRKSVSANNVIGITLFNAGDGPTTGNISIKYVIIKR